MIIVTCAIIRNEDNEVLVVQRGEKTDHPFKWEFPGGKLQDGETEEECIIREIMEELSMEVVICGKFETVVHDYGHKKIKLIPFICDTLDELPVLLEHEDFKWVSSENLGSVDLCEADVLIAGRYLEITGKQTHKKESEPEADQSPVIDKELRKMINNMMSMKEAEWLAASTGENPALFQKLLDYSYSTDKKLAFRASWILSKVCDKFPELIYPHLEKITEELDGIDNESTQRSFLRILSLTDLQKISERHHGILADHCFKALNSGFSAIAIKAYSMEIIYKLALIYPGLANELAASINMLQGENSAAGIVARGRMIMKRIAEISKS
ncbi:MAG: (deoxy)nucleoside triphosphate pyrophosphohydrolase [Bacteroidia bacterium]|nr:(deoxy)nucleoside triphosphate pyrophosphohydrolase [Bacteroidia bacterium]